MLVSITAGRKKGIVVLKWHPRTLIQAHYLDDMIFGCCDICSTRWSKLHVA